ncbi:lactate dehydrogenase-like 2-hydroxyacid dehydrogenase [Aequitasia blattaphilus]|uniref:D-2-hydroxyacid dehydrogenase n=1 Tax=Aequitasia blattaphilus TaxID=2949332 RepID=A0ABT1EAM0_9FIRM|nr:D-2-hydroxyacid dehydrogenase [Aequitasia blattaphilus]MCP1102731.1 D-2-hydroxyacid dehydrogenase [Aequitasia blattaphilus]MCR8615371.1 D-2-hydroxyacid dehydrogenase [Aequitasia blattaphilus]
MNIVFLDAKTIGDDIDLAKFDSLGTVTKYSFSTDTQARERLANADVVIVNKVNINKYTLENAKNLKLVCVTATGTNNLDKDFLKMRNIEWRNVAGYSTDSVAQHTFALLFYLLEKLRYYDEYVKSGSYVNDVVFTHFDQVFFELKDKTFGIIGLGNIGRKVSTIATAFGMNVIYTSPSGSPPQAGFTQVDLDTLLSTSDIVSIHAPLNEYTENLMNLSNLKKMKKSAILLNLGRGPIVVESDLKIALEKDMIAAAGLDVLTQEPMSEENPLLAIKNSEKLFITPHIAWASVEARNRLMDTIYHQVKEMFSI